jgi:S-adenosylmethionine-diacylgycerolhomoserine-N-methlytransferase
MGASTLPTLPLEPVPARPRRSLRAELSILYHLLLKPVRGRDHAARLESFYAGQADQYDAFRRRLLPGREDLYRRIEPPDGGTWVDLGGGTGANLEAIGPRLGRLGALYVVDLSPSLLAVAQRRIRQRGWSQVQTVEADACRFRPPDRAADVVTLSYALTMIPDWFAAVENARAMLRPGGLIGVVDFYVSRKYPRPGHVRHGRLTRSFWPAWFGCDNVFLSPDHLPYLHHGFEPVHFFEGRAAVPYLPLGRVPYYVFIGRKRG